MADENLLAGESLGDQESLVDSIVDKLGDVEVEVDDNGAPVQADSSQEGAEGNAQGEDEGTTPEPAEKSLIEPPLSWSKEHRERWSALPRETQEIIHSRETARDAEVRRGQNEVAEAKKAIEADKATTAQERQRYAETLQIYLNAAATLDPILADGQKTDWAALALSDPAGAQQKWFAYQQRITQVQGAVKEREALQHRQLAEHFEREESALLDKMPEWRADPEKAKTELTDIRKGAVDRYGFTPQEVAVIRDHRMVPIVRDALAYHALMAKQAAAQKTAQEKKAPPAPQRLAASGANEGKPSVNGNVAALKQRGKDTRLAIDDRVDAILAQL